MATTVGRSQMLYGIPDAARQVALSRSTLYVLIAAGELETVTFGRRRLITHEALEDLAQRMREGTVSLPGAGR